MATFVIFTRLNEDGDPESLTINADAITYVESDAGATRIWFSRAQNDYTYVEESLTETFVKLGARTQCPIP